MVIGFPGHLAPIPTPRAFARERTLGRKSRIHK